MMIPSQIELQIDQLRQDIAPQEMTENKLQTAALISQLLHKPQWQQNDIAALKMLMRKINRNGWLHSSYHQDGSPITNDRLNEPWYSILVLLIFKLYFYDVQKDKKKAGH